MPLYVAVALQQPSSKMPGVPSSRGGYLPAIISQPVSGVYPFVVQAPPPTTTGSSPSSRVHFTRTSGFGSFPPPGNLTLHHRGIFVAENDPSGGSAVHSALLPNHTASPCGNCAG